MRLDLRVDVLKVLDRALVISVGVLAIAALCLRYEMSVSNQARAKCKEINERLLVAVVKNIDVEVEKIDKQIEGAEEALTGAERKVSLAAVTAAHALEETEMAASLVASSEKTLETEKKAASLSAEAADIALGDSESADSLVVSIEKITDEVRASTLAIVAADKKLRGVSNALSLLAADAARFRASLAYDQAECEVATIRLRLAYLRVVRGALLRERRSIGMRFVFY